MTQEGQIPPPPVIWAQRKDIIFITICLEDCKDPTINIEPDKIYFKGIGGTEKKLHEVTFNLYQEIIPSQSIKKLGSRIMEIVLMKKEDGPYWPRLIKEKAKAHWLKSDFNKWKDENETDEEGEVIPDLAEMVRQMGSVEDPEDKPNYEDLVDLGDNGDEMDSDDDDLPDLLD